MKNPELAIQYGLSFPIAFTNLHLVDKMSASLTEEQQPQLLAPTVLKSYKCFSDHPKLLTHIKIYK